MIPSSGGDQKQIECPILVAALVLRGQGWSEVVGDSGGSGYCVGSPSDETIRGAMLWAASHLGWLPAAGLCPAATRELPERDVLMLAAHVI